MTSADMSGLPTDLPASARLVAQAIGAVDDKVKASVHANFRDERGRELPYHGAGAPDEAIAWALVIDAWDEDGAVPVTAEAAAAFVAAWADDGTVVLP